MEILAGRRGALGFLLAAAAVLVAAVLALGGCASTATTTGAPVSSPPPAPRPAPRASTGSTGGCNGDYCAPADWDTARAATPLAQIPPFVEPLNVVISARSRIALGRIYPALGIWHTV